MAYPNEPTSSITVIISNGSGPFRSAATPTSTRTATPTADPDDNTSPAAAGPNPTWTAVVVTKVPSALAAAEPNPPATAINSSARSPDRVPESPESATA